MAAITAEMVRTLREETGAGMMDCKKALTEADGDIAEAKVVLRKKGQASLAKRQGRVSGEGIVEEFVSEAGDVGVLLELNCETDFVARGEAFKGLAGQLARVIAASPVAGGYASTDELLAAPSEPGSSQTVTDLIADSAGQLGEKIDVARFTRYDVGAETQAIGAYIHRTDLKTGVLVEVQADKPITDNAPLVELAREVALHIAAANPQYASRDLVPQELVENERNIATAKMAADPKFADKPEQAKNAMLEGQIRKFYEQSVLVDQPYVRDPSGKQSVGALAAEVGKKVGAGVTVTRFVRYRVGESAAAAASADSEAAENANG